MYLFSKESQELEFLLNILCNAQQIRFDGSGYRLEDDGIIDPKPIGDLYGIESRCYPHLNTLKRYIVSTLGVTKLATAIEVHNPDFFELNPQKGSNLFLTTYMIKLYKDRKV